MEAVVERFKTEHDEFRKKGKESCSEKQVQISVKKMGSIESQITYILNQLTVINKQAIGVHLIEMIERIMKATDESERQLAFRDSLSLLAHGITKTKTLESLVNAVFEIYTKTRQNVSLSSL